MPTGYTAAVQDGTITTLKDFAMHCARAMGALVSMRDLPASAPIPERIEPSAYLAEAKTKAAARLANLRAMDDMQMEIAAALDHDKRMAAWTRRHAEQAIHRARYESMLEEVQAWLPPTAEHDNLKGFMLDQIESSIKWDLAGWEKPPRRLPAREWHAAEMKDAIRAYSDAARAHAEDLARVDRQNTWLDALRLSLEMGHV